jgi:zinc/manganese transport system permease protein
MTRPASRRFSRKDCFRIGRFAVLALCLLVAGDRASAQTAAPRSQAPPGNAPQWRLRLLAYREPTPPLAQEPAEGVPDVDQLLREATTPTTAESPSAPSPDQPDWRDQPAETGHVGELLFWPFLACLVLTGIHCYLGIHVIARGVIFVDLALAQMAALGSVLALVVGFDPHGDEAYSLSLITTMLGAVLFATGRLKRQVVPQEAIIGIIYAVSSALALLVLYKAPAEQAEETQHMLVGRILFVTREEVLKMIGLYAAVGLFHWVFRRRFLAISLHPDLAQEQGLAVRWWDFLFYASFGVVVTSSVQMAGVLLVFSYLIVPSVCATLMARNIGSRLVIGWAIGFLASLLGLFCSFEFDFPTGESIITVFGGLLVLIAIARWLNLVRTT